MTPDYYSTGMTLRIKSLPYHEQIQIEKLAQLGQFAQSQKFEEIYEGVVWSAKFQGISEEVKFRMSELYLESNPE